MEGNANDDLSFGRGTDDTLTGVDGSPDSLYASHNDFAFDRNDGTDTATNFQIGRLVCRLLLDSSMNEIILKRTRSRQIPARLSRLLRQILVALAAASRLTKSLVRNAIPTLAVRTRANDAPRIHGKGGRWMTHAITGSQQR